MSTRSCSTYAYQSSYFFLNIKTKKKSAEIAMQLYTEFVNTEFLPHTTTVLKKHLPSVLQTECFNEDGRTFDKEVECTEIGHLFEHVLIEYLCLICIENGADSAVFNGKTNWNWIKHTYGSFRIVVDVCNKDKDIFLIALKKTIELTERILENTTGSHRQATCSSTYEPIELTSTTFSSS